MLPFYKCLFIDLLNICKQQMFLFKIIYQILFHKTWSLTILTYLNSHGIFNPLKLINSLLSAYHLSSPLKFKISKIPPLQPGGNKLFLVLLLFFQQNILNFT